MQTTPFAATSLSAISKRMIKRLLPLPACLALFGALSGCSKPINVVIPEGEMLSVMVGPATFQVPFEYEPYIGEMVARDLYQKKLLGVGTQADPIVAQSVSITVVDDGLSGLSLSILETSDLVPFEEQPVPLDFSKFESLKVRGPTPGPDDPNSIYREYNFSAQAEFSDGQMKHMPFACRSSDDFEPGPDSPIFGCYISFSISNELGLSMRVDPGDDLAKLGELIRVAMKTMASMQHGNEVPG
ncbi:hypothetical protein [Erythrobacter ani]|uniref:Lipoprotein n=1 Tax=Erythrobacter ani TaxID=2827235 RepID=A0ABS6SR72_9SPHN|nr:hypothetical protein [Erythrobacter ani]MBV7267544.1 hypothetical protein [Erythrobacter ani]